MMVQTSFVGAFVLVVAVLVFLTVFVRPTATFGMALLVAATAMASGALLGFLFGIPRSLQADRAERPASAPSAQNTNLEQISDWLTKILVGVGLVQFGAIGAAAGRLITSISAAFEPMAGAKVVAGALLVLPAVTGFMIGYIGTRTLLFQMFGQFANTVASLVRQEVDPVREKMQQDEDDREELRKLVLMLNDQLDSRGAQPNPGDVPATVQRATPTQRDVAFQIAKRARRAPGVDQAALRRTIPVFRALVEAEPDRYVYRAELGAALADIGEHQEAITALTRAIEQRGATSARFDWFEFHRARARIGLVQTLARLLPYMPDGARRQ